MLVFIKSVKKYRYRTSIYQDRNLRWMSSSSTSFTGKTHFFLFRKQEKKLPFLGLMIIAEETIAESCVSSKCIDIADSKTYRGIPFIRNISVDLSIYLSLFTCYFSLTHTLSLSHTHAHTHTHTLSLSLSLSLSVYITVCLYLSIYLSIYLKLLFISPFLFLYIYLSLFTIFNLSNWIINHINIFIYKCTEIRMLSTWFILTVHACEKKWKKIYVIIKKITAHSFSFMHTSATLWPHPFQLGPVFQLLHARGRAKCKRKLSENNKSLTCKSHFYIWATLLNTKGHSLYQINFICLLAYWFSQQRALQEGMAMFLMWLAKFPRCQGQEVNTALFVSHSTLLTPFQMIEPKMDSVLLGSFLIYTLDLDFKIKSMLCQYFLRLLSEYQMWCKDRKPQEKKKK